MLGCNHLQRTGNQPGRETCPCVLPRRLPASWYKHSRPQVSLGFGLVTWIRPSSLVSFLPGVSVWAAPNVQPNVLICTVRHEAGTEALSRRRAVGVGITLYCCLHSFQAAACSRAAVNTLCLELGAAQCSLAAPGGPGKTLHGALAGAAASANLIAAEAFPAAKVCSGGTIRVPPSELASSRCSLPSLPGTDQTLLHRRELACYDGKEIATAAHERPFSRMFPETISLQPCKLASLALKTFSQGL